MNCVSGWTSVFCPSCLLFIFLKNIYHNSERLCKYGFIFCIHIQKTKSHKITINWRTNVFSLILLLIHFFQNLYYSQQWCMNILNLTFLRQNQTELLWVDEPICKYVWSDIVLHSSIQKPLLFTTIMYKWFEFYIPKKNQSILQWVDNSTCLLWFSFSFVYSKIIILHNDAVWIV